MEVPQKIKNRTTIYDPATPLLGICQRKQTNKQNTSLKRPMWDFPGGPVVKNPPANAEDTVLIPGPGRFHMPQSD